MTLPSAVIRVSGILVPIAAVGTTDGHHLGVRHGTGVPPHERVRSTGDAYFVTQMVSLVFAFVFPGFYEEHKPQERQ